MSDFKSAIRNPDRVKQVIDFGGLRYGPDGRMFPTDIDAFMEIRRQLFIFYEYKYRGTDIKGGQKPALMTLVNLLRSAGKEAVLFSCLHDEADPSKPINAAEAEVDKYFYHGDWFFQEKNVKSVLETTDNFIRHAAPGRISDYDLNMIMKGH